MPGITSEDTDVIQKPDFINVSQMAITNSDALIYGSQKVAPALDTFVRESGKPFLEYQGPENYIDAYSEFYKEVLGI